MCIVIDVAATFRVTRRRDACPRKCNDPPRSIRYAQLEAIHENRNTKEVEIKKDKRKI